MGIGALSMGAAMVAGNAQPIEPEDPIRSPATQPGDESVGSSFIGAVGVTEPPGEAVLIASHTSGIVAEVSVSVGDRVTPGDPLFVVDQRRALQTLELRRATLGVASADAESLRADIPPARADVRAAEAALMSARANVAAAEAELADRANLLRVAESVEDPRAIASEEIDRRRFAQQRAEAGLAVAQAAVAEAEAAVSRAEARLARLVEPDTAFDGPDLVAATERVREAQQELEVAETELDLLTVTSPVEGRVLQVNVRAGEFATAATASEGLIVLGRDGLVHMRVEIDEVDAARFSSGARAWASPRGASDTRFDLELAFVEPLIVAKTNLAGRTSELIDTRVLQVIYALPTSFDPAGIGQQFDVFIAAPGDDGP
ncbi:MAG: biotin/lipoyl-binding protein [Planctomycetota bacterium]